MIAFFLGGAIAVLVAIYNIVNTAFWAVAIFSAVLSFGLLVDPIKSSFLADLVGPQSSLVWAGLAFISILLINRFKENGAYASAAVGALLFLAWIIFDSSAASNLCGIIMAVVFQVSLKRMIIPLIIGEKNNETFFGCIVDGILLYMITCPALAMVLNALIGNGSGIGGSILTGAFFFLSPIYIWYSLVSLRQNGFI